MSEPTLQSNEGRLWGIDWSDADEVSVSSRGWRQAPDKALHRGVGISLANSKDENGLIIVVNAARAREIAKALIEAAGQPVARP
jgi:hypothetical protein